MLSKLAYAIRVLRGKAAEQRPAIHGNGMSARRLLNMYIINEYWHKGVFVPCQEWLCESERCSVLMRMGKAMKLREKTSDFAAMVQ
jgi:hypothetical protein